MARKNGYLTAREAAELAGCSTRHVQVQIKLGKMSATRTETGSYLIEKSEFYRVFPDAFKPTAPRTDANEDEKNARTLLENEIKYLKQMLEEKEKNTEFLKDQMNRITTALTSNARLLEDKTNKEHERQEQQREASETKKKFWPFGKR